MAKYKTIAVIYGSDSSESEVSCRSGEFVASRLDGSMYDIYEVFARFGKWSLVAYKKKDSMRVILPEGARPEIDKTNFSVNLLGQKVKFDYAYIAQHGSPGENGLMEGYLEMLSVPFSTCSAYVSTVAFDKYACKSHLREQDMVKCAPDVYVRRGMNLELMCAKIESRLTLPVFVKPTQGGSSFGVTKVNSFTDLLPAIRFAFTEGDSVIVEQGVKGREITCAVYFDGLKVRALPVIEIVTENDYFDYDAKYNGHSSEICPADLSDTQRETVQKTSCEIYSNLGCKGVVRMDYILSDDGLYFLEINTIPGMTSASLVPKMVRTASLDMTAFLSTIIENS